MVTDWPCTSSLTFARNPAENWRSLSTGRGATATDRTDAPASCCRELVRTRLTHGMNLGPWTASTSALKSATVLTKSASELTSAATLTAVVVVAAAVVAVASGAADSVSAVSVAPPQAVSAKAAAASMTSRLTGMPPRRAITVVGRRALAGDREPWPSGAVIGPVLGLYWACSGIRRMIDARSAQLSSVLTMDFSGSSPARVGAAAPGFVVLHTVARGAVGAWWLWTARSSAGPPVRQLAQRVGERRRRG